MKKIISIVLGVAALAACTKTSVSYEQPGEIALAPVTRANMTKAAITGTTFPTTNDMGVYAFYNAGKLAGTPKADFLTGSAAYLDNVEFVNKTGSGNWGGRTSYYWPKTGSLVFAAYSPKAANLAYSAGEDKFSKAEYVQSTDLANTVDLLWSPMTATSHDKGTEEKFKVKSVELNGIVNKGAFKTSGATIAWTPSTLADDVQNLSVLNNGESYTEIKKMTPAVVLENVEKGTVVIPQSLGDAVTLTVVFSQMMPTGAWSADQTLHFQLNQCKVGGESLNSWDNGKHYIYTLSFNIKGEGTGENEILIAPKLEDWKDVTVDSINAQ